LNERSKPLIIRFIENKAEQSATKIIHCLIGYTMSEFTIHTLESAPETSKEAVEASIKGNGFLPGLHGVMAEAPGLLEGYQVLHKLFTESSFNAEELTVVWQTINVEHACHYCVPAHTGIAHMMKVDPALTEALRNQEAMPTEKLQVLHETTLAMTRNRGFLTQEEITRFFEAGYAQRQLLEIVLGLSQKVMSNYTNHLAETPVDSVFEQFAWQPK
jgi:alkylhydroperoxidase family enzyme